MFYRAVLQFHRLLPAIKYNYNSLFASFDKIDSSVREDINKESICISAKVLGIKSDKMS